MTFLANSLVLPCGVVAVAVRFFPRPAAGIGNVAVPEPFAVAVTKYVAPGP